MQLSGGHQILGSMCSCSSAHSQLVQHLPLTTPPLLDGRASKLLNIRKAALSMACWRSTVFCLGGNVMLQGNIQIAIIGDECRICKHRKL